MQGEYREPGVTALGAKSSPGNLRPGAVSASVMSSPKPPSSSRFTGPAVFLGLLVTFGAVRVAHLHTPPDESTLSFPPAEPDAEPRFAAFSVGADQKDEERHSGEEGKMGKPTSKKKSGLYAIEGPKDLIPRSAYGGAYAVGNDDEDVWGGLTGTEIGEAVGVGGLGLVGKGRGGGGTGLGYGRGTGVLQHQSGHFLAAPGSAEAMGRDGYREFVEQTLKQVADDPLSTFSVDVDTA